MGKLSYECEYLNGERLRKIKEFDANGNLIFEGEVSDGDLKFEGEYVNGIGNGKGKEYDFLVKLLFKGEYINGKRKKNDCLIY